MIIINAISILLKMNFRYNEDEKVVGSQNLYQKMNKNINKKYISNDSFMPSRESQSLPYFKKQISLTSAKKVTPKLDPLSSQIYLNWSHLQQLQRVKTEVVPLNKNFIEAQKLKLLLKYGPNKHELISETQQLDSHVKTRNNRSCPRYLKTQILQQKQHQHLPVIRKSKEKSLKTKNLKLKMKDQQIMRNYLAFIYKKDKRDSKNIKIHKLKSNVEESKKNFEIEFNEINIANNPIYNKLKETKKHH